MKQKKNIFVLILLNIIILGTLTGCFNKDESVNESKSDKVSTSTKETSKKERKELYIEYNGKEYLLQDMSKVLFEDGWKIQDAMFTIYTITNDKYSYSLDIQFDDNTKKPADLATSIEEINSKEVIDYLKESKLSSIKITPSYNKKNDENISIWGINLNTPRSKAVSLLPKIKSSFDSDTNQGSQRLNKIYKVNIDYNPDEVITYVKLIRYSD